EALLSRAAVLAPQHTGVLKARALLHRAHGRFSEAIAATAMVIARNPGEPTSYKEMGLNKLCLGETEEAGEWVRRADAIETADPGRWTWLQGLGRALMQLGRDAEAVGALSQSMDHKPRPSPRQGVAGGSRGAFGRRRESAAPLGRIHRRGTGNDDRA